MKRDSWEEIEYGEDWVYDEEEMPGADQEEPLGTEPAVRATDGELNKFTLSMETLFEILSDPTLDRDTYRRCVEWIRRLTAGALASAASGLREEGRLAIQRLTDEVLPRVEDPVIPIVAIPALQRLTFSVITDGTTYQLGSFCLHSIARDARKRGHDEAASRALDALSELATERVKATSRKEGLLYSSFTNPLRRAVSGQNASETGYAEAEKDSFDLYRIREQARRAAPDPYAVLKTTVERLVTVMPEPKPGTSVLQFARDVDRLAKLPKGLMHDYIYLPDRAVEIELARLGRTAIDCKAVAHVESVARALSEITEKAFEQGFDRRAILGVRELLELLAEAVSTQCAEVVQRLCGIIDSLVRSVAQRGVDALSSGRALARDVRRERFFRILSGRLASLLDAVLGCPDRAMTSPVGDLVLEWPWWGGASRGQVEVLVWTEVLGALDRRDWTMRYPGRGTAGPGGDATDTAGEQTRRREEEILSEFGSHPSLRVRLFGELKRTLHSYSQSDDPGPVIVAIAGLWREDVRAAEHGGEHPYGASFQQLLEEALKRIGEDGNGVSNLRLGDRRAGFHPRVREWLEAAVEWERTPSCRWRPAEGHVPTSSPVLTGSVLESLAGALRVMALSAPNGSGPEGDQCVWSGWMAPESFRARAPGPAYGRRAREDHLGANEQRRGPDDDRVYVGLRRAHGVIVLVREPDGSQRLLRDAEGRARGVFEWGYGGGGPHDLAPVLLDDALEELTRCPSCHGASFGEYGDPSYCRFCHGSRRRPEMHRLSLALVDEKVAGWRRERRGVNWQISRSELLGWALRSLEEEAASAGQRA